MENLTAELRNVVTSNLGLSSHLAQIENGRHATPRSWLYEAQPADEVRDRWLDKLSSLRSGTSNENRVYQFDTSQLSKWGPQGAIPALKNGPLKVVLGAYSSELASSAFSDPEWKRAIVSARIQLFGNRAQLRPASYQNVVEEMRMRDTLSTNSGWPDYTRRSVPETKIRAVSDASSGAWIDYPAIVLFRHYYGKIRQVWMFPMATNIVEASYANPIMSFLRKRQCEAFAPWEGFSFVQDVMSSWMKDPSGYVFGGDFTAMDNHMRPSQMEQVFELLAPVFQKEFVDGLRSSLLNSVNIGLVLTRTQWLPPQPHGLASGSVWTQLAETLFQTIVYEYLSLKLNVKLRGVMVIGDDSATFAPRTAYPIAEHLVALFKTLGMESNIEKQSDSLIEVTFLQRLFRRGYYTAANKVRAVYPTLRALESSVFPERWHSQGFDESMFAARQYMILENCVDHPMFEDFVRYVVGGQKGLIPFAKLSESELNRVTAKANLIPSLRPTYNQEKRDSSLSNFESIKLARKL